MSFIPGMTGNGSAYKPRPRAPLTFVEKIGEASSFNEATVSWPSGHRAGDLLLFYDWCADRRNNPLSVIPAGFTLINTDLGASGEIFDPPDDEGRLRVNLSYKILDGTEPSSGFITGMVENRHEAKIAVLFRGDARIKSVVPLGLSAQISTTNVDEVTIPSASGVVPLIAYAFHAKNVTNSLINFTKDTPAFQEIIRGSKYAIAGYKIYLDSPFNHTVDADGSGNVDTSGTGDSYSAVNYLAVNMMTGYLQLA